MANDKTLAFLAALKDSKNPNTLKKVIHLVDSSKEDTKHELQQLTLDYTFLLSINNSTPQFNVRLADSCAVFNSAELMKKVEESAQLNFEHVIFASAATNSPEVLEWAIVKNPQINLSQLTQKADRSGLIYTLLEIPGISPKVTEVLLLNGLSVNEKYLYSPTTESESDKMIRAAYHFQKAFAAKKEGNSAAMHQAFANAVAFHPLFTCRYLASLICKMNKKPEGPHDPSILYFVSLLAQIAKNPICKDELLFAEFQQIIVPELLGYKENERADTLFRTIDDKRKYIAPFVEGSPYAATFNKMSGTPVTEEKEEKRAASPANQAVTSSTPIKQPSAALATNQQSSVVNLSVFKSAEQQSTVEKGSLDDEERAQQQVAQ